MLKRVLSIGSESHIITCHVLEWTALVDCLYNSMSAYARSLIVREQRSFLNVNFCIPGCIRACLVDVRCRATLILDSIPPCWLVARVGPSYEQTVSKPLPLPSNNSRNCQIATSRLLELLVYDIALGFSEKPTPNSVHRDLSRNPWRLTGTDECLLLFQWQIFHAKCEVYCSWIF